MSAVSRFHVLNFFVLHVRLTERTISTWEWNSAGKRWQAQRGSDGTVGDVGRQKRQTHELLMYFFTHLGKNHRSQMSTRVTDSKEHLFLTFVLMTLSF